MIAAHSMAMASLGVGAFMGLFVVAAAVAAGRTQGWRFFMGGGAWGALTAVFVLTDCLAVGGRGPVSDLSFPVFFGGLFVWPVIMAWRQPMWLLKWFLAQMVMLVTVLPAALVATLAAMCSIT